MNNQPANQRGSLRESYNKHAQERDANAIPPWKADMRARYLALLQAQACQTLLEIGAGPGHDSIFFKEQGLDVTCIDLSPAMVALCRQKGLNALEMDMVNLSFPAAAFDAVFAMNSLLHLPKAEFLPVLRQIERVLKPGGLAFIGVHGGYEFEGIWALDHYRPQRFFSFFTDEAIQAAAAQVFEILAFDCVFFEKDGPMHHQELTLQKREGRPVDSDNAEHLSR